MNTAEAVELSEGIFWVGQDQDLNGLHCNAYLLTEGEQGVLIDPGSNLDYKEVHRKTTGILPIEKLEYIILLHQDPDVASSVPRFQEAGFTGQIATHWRTSLIAAYYGINPPWYLVNKKGYKIVFGGREELDRGANNTYGEGELSAGRELEVIPAPYLHFPGAVMIYDSRSRILFSGDVFGAISKDWSLFADSNYTEGMLRFHREYVPSNDIIRPVMENLLERKIDMICPQHGSIISDNIPEYIRALRDLECGIYLEPVRKALLEDVGYTHLVNKVLGALVESYGVASVLETFADTDVMLDQATGMLQDYAGDLENLWNELFEQIYIFRGIDWIMLLEPLVRKIEHNYGIHKPVIYQNELFRTQQQMNVLLKEKQRLEAINQSLRNNLNFTQEAMTKDSVTGLFNEDFCVRFLLNIFNQEQWDDFSVLFFLIDDMKQINSTYGERAGNDILESTGAVLFYQKHDDDTLFRISGPAFALVTSVRDQEDLLGYAEKFRVSIENDRGFLTKVTVSVGIVRVQNSKLAEQSAPESMEQIFSRGRMSLRSVQREGGNRVLFDSDIQGRDEDNGRAVILEFDQFHARLIRESLEALSIETRVCMNGPEAVQTALEFHPDVIVSELFLLENDAFSVREDLMEYTKTKDIPFILISHQKNEAMVIRAQSLGILHYIKKPYMLPELLGLITSYVQQAFRHEP
ncbi:MAG: diguanylate cyclase [Spirochaetales bacterium]|nr:diguanylate cyclase [Spirochaetales bacterium]MCF7937020.1 diguanylate cyclase [Spirochaetales bacterium]